MEDSKVKEVRREIDRILNKENTTWQEKKDLIVDYVVRLSFTTL